MARTCCQKPVVKTIKVAEFEAGISGLEEAFVNVSRSNPRDEDELGSFLLSWVREMGNYIAPSREADYRKALLREYKKYHGALRSEAPRTTASKRA